jgi:AcrR family transcriptional regulator
VLLISSSEAWSRASRDSRAISAFEPSACINSINLFASSSHFWAASHSATGSVSSNAGASAEMADTERGYHHGALRQALIDATESLLAERGAEGFSLREVARRSGVSPAAPAHHFGDAAGLLTAVSTLAFEGLNEALQAGNARGGDDPAARLREQGIGYVGFALRFPGRFGLMFSAGRRDDPDFQCAAKAAFMTLEDGVRDLYGVPRGTPLDASQWHMLLATWSVVHGFAHLALSGQFDRLAGAQGRDAWLRRMLGPTLEQLDGLAPKRRAAKRRVAKRKHT